MKPHAHAFSMFSLLCEHTKYISEQILCPLNKHNLPSGSSRNLKKKLEKIDTLGTF